MQEAINEWLIMDEANMKFHMGQYENPYRSTVKFVEFLQDKLQSTRGNSVCDLGCGAGAVLDYLLNQDNKIFAEGYGIDISANMVEIGNSILAERNTNNCKLEVADIFHLDKKMVEKFDGVVSLQTFNILPDYREIVEVMCSLKPSWIAFSTLAFEGMIDYYIRLHDYTKDKDGNYAEVFYNVYSLPLMKKYFEDLGYKNFSYKEFEIDVDLPQTNKLGRGTYTVKMESGKRIQISGGMMMPWYFCFVSK